MTMSDSGLLESLKSFDLSLEQHIKAKHGNSKKAFAAFMGVKPQQVTQWINKGCIVYNGQLFSPRRPMGMD